MLFFHVCLGLPRLFSLEVWLPSLFSLGSFYICFFIVIIGKYISKMRLITGRKTDERIQVTQETLSAIRIIKMYTWEKYFGDRITASRM